VIVAGAYVMYLEPWHTDIFEFLELKLKLETLGFGLGLLFVFKLLLLYDCFVIAMRFQEVWYLRRKTKLIHIFFVFAV
jgi:hypothetical protein